MSCQTFKRLGPGLKDKSMIGHMSDSGLKDKPIIGHRPGLDLQFI
jgi:hypothetical protein